MKITVIFDIANDLVELVITKYYLRLNQNPSSRRRPGPSPVVVLNNTMGWIPAFAGMTNQFDLLSLIHAILNIDRATKPLFAE